MACYSTEDLSKTREIIVPLLQKLIQNRCINCSDRSGGNETVNAKALQDFFAQANIPSILKGVVENRDSLVAVVPGSLENPTIYSLMGHIDVVGADSSKWSFDPFSGQFDGAWVYGRGTVAMLGQIAIMAAAMREVIQENGTPLQTIKYFAFADEEADGVLGAGALLDSEAELFRCDKMLTELGGYFIDDNHISIASCEKGVLRIQLVAHGCSGHGSMPYKAENAALLLNKAIAKISEIEIKPLYTQEARYMIQAMPFPAELKEALLNPATLEEALSDLYKCSPCLAKLVHSSLFLTMSLGLVNAGIAVNVIPYCAEAHYDIRIQPGQTKEMIIKLFNEALSGLNIDIYEREYCEPNASAINTHFTKTLEETVKSFYPDAKLVPVVPAGVTDGRYFRKKGTDVYGFSLFSRKYSYDFFAKRLHGVDEKIDLESLAIGFSFYKRLLKEILYVEN